MTSRSSISPRSLETSLSTPLSELAISLRMLVTSLMTLRLSTAAMLVFVPLRSGADLG